MCLKMTVAEGDETTTTATRVIQVTNVAKTATFEQLKSFFDVLGGIEEMKIYPTQ